MSPAPTMPSGYNSWENDGDVVNGGGVNEPIWPNVFDSFEPISSIILPPDVNEIFSSVPDLVIRGQANRIVFSREFRTLVIEEPE